MPRLRNVVVGAGASLPATDNGDGQSGAFRDPAVGGTHQYRLDDERPVVLDLPGLPHPRWGRLHQDVVMMAVVMRLVCPVCEGAGHWDKLTGYPVWTKPPPDGAHRCPFCEGTGKAPERRL